MNSKGESTISTTSISPSSSGIIYSSPVPSAVGLRLSGLDSPFSAALQNGAPWIAGLIGGASGIFVGQPFDTVKTLQQTHNGANGKLPPMQQLALSIFRENGVRGLFRGMAYPLATYGFANASGFGAYEAARGYFEREGGGSIEGQLTYTQIGLAGCIGGFAVVPAVCPSELIKVKLQYQLETEKANRGTGKPALYRGPIHCTRVVIRESGLRGMYKGAGLCVCRDVPGYCVFFVVYEFVKDFMEKKGCGQTFRELTAGGSAGVVSWLSIFPLDLLKTHVQANASLSPSTATSACLNMQKLATSAAGSPSSRSNVAPTVLTSVRSSPLASASLGHSSPAASTSPKQALSLAASMVSNAKSSFGSKWSGAADKKTVLSARVTVSEVVRALYRTEGIKGFYKGAAVTGIRAVPSCAATFYVYEEAMRFINRLV